MEMTQTTQNAPVTKADLKAEFGKFEERLDKKAGWTPLRAGKRHSGSCGRDHGEEAG